MSSTLSDQFAYHIIRYDISMIENETDNMADHVADICVIVELCVSKCFFYY